jgi:hypothetical protein
VESLATPLSPPAYTFQSYSQSLALGNGTARGGGWPVATWAWGFITQAQYNAFKAAYCSGKSAAVYVYTINSTGSYQEYTATLVWPDERDLEFVNGRVLDVVLTFINLEVYS